MSTTTTTSTSTSPGVPSYWAFQNLIASYPELVDSGDFAGLGEVLAHARFTLHDGPTVIGRDAIEIGTQNGSLSNVRHGN